MTEFEAHLKYLDPNVAWEAAKNFEEYNDIPVTSEHADAIFEKYNRLGGDYVYSSGSKHDLETPKVYCQYRQDPGMLFVESDYKVKFRVIEKSGEVEDGEIKRITQRTVIAFFFEKDPAFPIGGETCAALLLMNVHTVNSPKDIRLHVKSHRTSDFKSIIKKTLGFLVMRQPDFGQYPWTHYEELPF